MQFIKKCVFCMYFPQDFVLSAENVLSSNFVSCTLSVTVVCTQTFSKIKYNNTKAQNGNLGNIIVLFCYLNCFCPSQNCKSRLVAKSVAFASLIFLLSLYITQSLCIFCRSLINNVTSETVDTSNAGTTVKISKW